MHGSFHLLYALSRFVLLKERNMLLTMEHAYLQAGEHMPNQERLDKVDMSMENLEEVVRERNRAFHELEVGGSGELEREIVEGPFGIDEGYQQREHPVPYWQNLAHQRKFKFRHRTGFGASVTSFYRRYRENLFRKQNYRKW